MIVKTLTVKKGQGLGVPSETTQFICCWPMWQKNWCILV
jgi:hypothetical protein